MTNLELIGAGLGGLGSLLLIPKVENRNFIIGAICITAGFLFPVYSHYTHPLDWAGIGGVTVIVLFWSIRAIWVIYHGKRKQATCHMLSKEDVKGIIHEELSQLKIDITELK